MTPHKTAEQWAEEVYWKKMPAGIPEALAESAITRIAEALKEYAESEIKRRMPSEQEIWEHIPTTIDKSGEGPLIAQFMLATRRNEWTMCVRWLKARMESKEGEK
jgi:hypothetical protein